MTIWDRPFIVYRDGKEVDPKPIMIKGHILAMDEKERSIINSGGSHYVSAPVDWLETVGNEGKVGTPLLIRGKILNEEGDPLKEGHFIVFCSPREEVRRL